MNNTEEAEHFAYLVIEYMNGEWNPITEKVRNIVTAILIKRYQEHTTNNQFRFIEQSFGMTDPEKTYNKDGSDLANAIEICKQETKLKYW
mgnify:CR=1 FL=1